MDLKAKFAVILMLLSPFLGTGTHAMTIEDFGRMNNDDEATYVTMLIEASAKMLRTHGQPDQASQVIAYFKVPGKFGGVQEFAASLRTFYGLNKKNATNPNNRATVYQVEDAMASTLNEKGFTVPARYLLEISKDFRPVGPPRQHIFAD